MEKTVGIVIKCKDYGETSQLAWIYTKDFGKIKIIAKGSRAKARRLKSRLDLFHYIDIVFYKNKRGELNTLSESDVVESFSEIRTDLGKIATASYMSELIDACTGLEDPCVKIFPMFLGVLKNLAKGKDPNLLRCIFEIKLINYLGHLPKLEGRKDLSKGAMAVFHRIAGSKTIDTLKISAKQLEELKNLLRLIIDYLVGKRLKSLNFMEAVSSSAGINR